MIARQTVFFVAAWVVAYAGCLNSGSAADYRAVAILRVNPDEPVVLGHPVRRDSEREFEMYKETHRYLVTGRSVLSAVLRNPEVLKLRSVQSQQQKGDPLPWLQGVVTVTYPGKANIMCISCNLGDSHEAAKLTNAVVDAYLDELSCNQRELRGQRISTLEDVVGEKETELRRKLETLNRLGTMFASDDAKTAKKPVPVDVQMLRLEVNTIQDFLHEVRMDLERSKVELRATPRVTLLTRADEMPSKL